MAAALDRGLCARPVLADLPGRFLFALDDGRGDVAAEDPDLCWQAPDRLLVAGVDTGLRVAAAEAVDALLRRGGGVPRAAGGGRRDGVAGGGAGRRAGADRRRAAAPVRWPARRHVPGKPLS